MKSFDSLKKWLIHILKWVLGIFITIITAKFLWKFFSGENVIIAKTKFKIKNWRKHPEDFPKPKIENPLTDKDIDNELDKIETDSNRNNSNSE